MQFLNQLVAEDRDRCLRMLAGVSGVRTHRGLFNWLRSPDMQGLLPHDAVLAAWGDLRGGNFQFDVVSALPGVRTAASDVDKLLPRAQQLFLQWVANREQPCAMDADVLNSIFEGPVLFGRTAWVHGLHDMRTGQDCLYVIVSSNAEAPAAPLQALAALLPHIDAGFRQVSTLPRRTARPIANAYHDDPQSIHRQPPEQIRLPEPAGLLNAMGMTERELQIMRWVEMGKTNHEIGAILDISAFTVKNHLQRIFKKLDVYSRAQAVSRFKDSMLHG